MDRQSKTKSSYILALLGLLNLGLLFSAPANAGVFELSVGFSFNQSNYSGDSFYWTRRWGASFAYHFSERSGLEFGFQDITDRTFIQGFQDTTFHDQIYSVSWIQSLLPKDYRLQPYFKIGVGQLNRDASGSYADGGVPPPRVDSITGVFAFGFKLFILQQFALRSEITTYLTGGSIRTWKDNIAFSVGLSFFF